MIKEFIAKIVEGRDLTQLEAERLMGSIMRGEFSPAQIGALLIAMRMKGETVDEITGFAKIMRKLATPIKVSHPLVVDTCGTGGDGAGTFNISTAAAFVLAGAGVPVAKHGNRSVSSSCGSADVLEALGVRIDLTPGQVEKCIDEVGIGFLFAPSLHGAMKHVAGPRREIGVRTVFNILGPLTNPAGAGVQVLGVYSEALVEPLAHTLLRLGVKRAFVVHGFGGLDEVSLSGPAVIMEVGDNGVKPYPLDPKDYGFERVDNKALLGGDKEKNAGIILKVLRGEKGPYRNVVLINSALGFVAFGLAVGIKEGIERAAECIESGAAISKLKQLVEYTRGVPVEKKAVSS